MGRYDALLTASLRELKLEELKEIPADSEINHTFSRDFQEKMEIIFSSVGEKSYYANRTTHIIIKKAAVFIICFIMTAFSIIMLNDEARANFYNAVSFIYEEYIKFGFLTDEKASSDFRNIEDVEITYTPEGFTLRETLGIYEAREYVYSCADRSFSVNVAFNDGLSVITDKNDSTVKETTVNDREAYIIYAKDEAEYGTVIITGSVITVTIYGQLQESELLKVAHGIQKKMPND